MMERFTVGCLIVDPHRGAQWIPRPVEEARVEMERTPPMSKEDERHTPFSEMNKSSHLKSGWWLSHSPRGLKMTSFSILVCVSLGHSAGDLISRK